jgi:hypothetical protein
MNSSILNSVNAPKPVVSAIRGRKKKKKKPRDSTATGQSYSTDGGDANEDLSDLPRFTLEEFLAIIAMDENARSFVF